jgi:hypothetical protein
MFTAIARSLAFPAVRLKLLLVPAAALVFGLVLLGCSAEFNVGGDSDASGEELAEEIRADYTDQAGVEMRGLTCEGVEGDEGEEFSCSGRNERSVQLKISGEVTDASGDGFDYEWRVTEAVAPGVLYERALRRQLEERGVGLSEVRCPVEIEIDVGEEIECEATDRNGVTRTVELRLTDRDGGFDYSVSGEEGSEAEGASASS